MNRFLIVRLGALGDIVHAIPVAAAIKRSFPAARIDWLVGAKHREILDLVPVIDRRLVFHDASVVSAIRELRSARYDVALDLQGLIKLIDLDGLTRGLKYPARGTANLGIDLSRVEGLPRKLVFGKQIFAMKKGRSVVPHGHDNMSTGFIILKGSFAGKHYDRVEDHTDHYLIKPTIDRTFKPAEFSTISDHKDNVHWFKAESEPACIFNLHVMGYNLENPKTPARVYVDPQGENAAGGLIVAKKMTSAECHKKYG